MNSNDSHGFHKAGLNTHASEEPVRPPLVSNPLPPYSGRFHSQDDGLTSLHTIGEVAHLLRKSKGQVRRLFGKGKLPEPIYVGRTPMWPRQVIERWIQAEIAKGGSR